MDHDDPMACWHLFVFTALLNESRYLAHPLKKLTTLLEESRGRNGARMAMEDPELKTLKRGLEHLESDVSRALDIVNRNKTEGGRQNYLSTRFRCPGASAWIRGE